MSDSESVTHVNPDEFKIAVKEWVMINDQLADNRKFVSERNKRKKQLTQFIISFMKDNDKEICNLGENGVLHMKETKKQATLNKDNLTKLAISGFPFYHNIVKMPLYREVEKALIFINDMEYDITNVQLDFAGPKLNYHLDLVKLRFEEIIDYSQDFPELRNVNGVINIEDNFGNKYVYNYPGEFIWNESLLD